MAITIPVTHVAKQKNRRRSPKSTGMSRLPHLPCAGSASCLQTRTIENEYRRNLFDVRDGADKIHGLPAMTRGRYGSLILHEIRSSLCVDLDLNGAKPRIA